MRDYSKYNDDIMRETMGPYEQEECKKWARALSVYFRGKEKINQSNIDNRKPGDTLFCCEEAQLLLNRDGDDGLTQSPPPYIWDNSKVEENLKRFKENKEKAEIDIKRALREIKYLSLDQINKMLKEIQSRHKKKIFIQDSN